MIQDSLAIEEIDEIFFAWAAQEGVQYKVSTIGNVLGDNKKRDVWFVYHHNPVDNQPETFKTDVMYGQTKIDICVAPGDNRIPLLLKYAKKVFDLFPPKRYNNFIITKRDEIAQRIKENSIEIPIYFYWRTNNGS